MASAKPRLPLDERYPGGLAEFVARRRAVAERLVRDRLLSPADLESAAPGAMDEASTPS